MLPLAFVIFVAVILAFVTFPPLAVSFMAVAALSSSAIAEGITVVPDIASASELAAKMANIANKVILCIDGISHRCINK